MSLGKNVAKGYFSPNRLLKRRLIKKLQSYLEGRQTEKLIYTLVFFNLFLQAVFQLHVFQTTVYARLSVNPI